MKTFLPMNAVIPQNESFPVKVCLIDNNSTIREEVAALINKTTEFRMVNTYPHCAEAIPNLREDQPDVILIDIELSCGKNSVEGIEEIKRLRPKTHIIVVTRHNEDEILFKALSAGAGGYLTKNTPAEKLLEAIREIQEGGAPMSIHIARRVVASFHKNQNSPLTQRETEVLELLAKGKSYTQIAQELFVNKETIRTHIKNIYWKLEVHTKADAIEKARQGRLI